MKLVKLGEADSVVGASMENALGYIYPENELWMESNVIYCRKDLKWDFKTNNSIDKIKLGVIAGYNYFEYFDKQIAKKASNINVVHGDGALARILGMISAARIDCVIDDENVIRYQILKLKQKISDYNKNVEVPGSKHKIYMVFSPANKERSNNLKKIFDNEIPKLKKSGEFKMLLDKYGIASW